MKPGCQRVYRMSALVEPEAPRGTPAPGRGGGGRGRCSPPLLPAAAARAPLPPGEAAGAAPAPAPAAARQRVPGPDMLPALGRALRAGPARAGRGSRCQLAPLVSLCGAAGARGRHIPARGRPGGAAWLQGAAQGCAGAGTSPEPRRGEQQPRSPGGAGWGGKDSRTQGVSEGAVGREAGQRCAWGAQVGAPVRPDMYPQGRQEAGKSCTL